HSLANTYIHTLSLHDALPIYFINADKIENPKDIQFTFTQNGTLKQDGNSKMMLYTIAEIISYLSHVYGLSAGDLIYTGTPEGVRSEEHTSNSSHVSISYAVFC